MDDLAHLQGAPDQRFGLVTASHRFEEVGQIVKIPADIGVTGLTFLTGGLIDVESLSDRLLPLSPVAGFSKQQT